MDRSKWRVDHEPDGIGSGHLEVRLEESLAGLSTRLGVAVPQNGRHRAAQAVLHRWNQTAASIDLDDRSLLQTLAEAHRLAWETFLIMVAAVEDWRNPRTPFTTNKLYTMLGGDLVTVGRQASHRDTQFELLLAAMLRLSSVSVNRGEPDLRIRYGYEEVGVAAKRISSKNIDQVQKRAREAARQIEREKLRGWIALNIDARFEDIEYPQDEPALIAAFAETFDAIDFALRRPSLKQHVLGFIVIGYLYSWHPPAIETDEPRLYWATPLRWKALTEEPGEYDLFKDFTEGWSNRWERRRRTLRSKDFEGVL